MRRESRLRRRWPSGWRAARPAGRASSAQRLTGLARELRARARPAGPAAYRRRRCAWPAARKALQRRHRELRRAGEDDAQRRHQIAGAPTRGRWARSGSRLLLLELLADAVALQLREVVDEQLAVEVIDLVLEADREQAVGLESRTAGRRGRAPARGSARRGARASSKMPGTDRQPSSTCVVPVALEDLRVDERHAALACRSARRRSRPAAGARRPASRPARCPAPRTWSRACRRSAGAASSSTRSTGTARVRSRGSGYSRMVSFAILSEILLKLCHA